MKKIFYLAILVILQSYTANSQELKNNSTDNIYTVDFVFTGKVNPVLDSVFAIRYKFARLSFNNFDKLLIDGNLQNKVLNLNGIKSNDSIEIQNEGGYTYLIFKKYDKADLPVIIQAVDKKGMKQDLSIRSNDGNVKGAREFKDMERSNNDRIRQIKTGRK